MQENITREDFQDTIPEEEMLDQTNAESNLEEIVTPNNENNMDEDVENDAEMQNVQSSASEKKEPFITVQYNHQNRNFTKDEAVQFIQKGMHTEALRKKLEYLAQRQNTDVNSIVDKIVTAHEQEYKKHLENMYGTGSEDVEIGMKIYREKQTKEYKDIVAASDNEKQKYNVNSRLADEYLYLKSQVPDAPSYNELPDSVIIEAASGKRDLFSAYLCHLHNEQTKIDAAQKLQNAAKNASTGTMNHTSGENISMLDRGFLSGLWSK